MTMRFVPTTVITSSNAPEKTVFAFFDFMHTASPGGPGWTVPRSSDGVTVVTDGSGSNITAFGDLSQWIAATSISWFVLRSPDGAQEFMWQRVSVQPGEWALERSIGALFIGGDITVAPTAVDSEFVHQPQNTLAQSAVIHMGADDAAPYGYWLFAHQPGNFATSRGGWAHIPVTATAAGDTDPYVHFMIDSNFGGEFKLADLWDENNTVFRTAIRAKMPGADTQTCPALAYQNSGGTMIPNKAPPDDNGDDVSFPIVFGRSTDEPTAGYKGITTFMQWNGFLRASGETFASRTRISWGDVNFPWDGSTPVVS